MGFVRSDAQMMKLHLRLRPGRRQSTFPSPCIPILICQLQYLLASRGYDGRKDNPHGGAWRDENRSLQAHHGVEHGTNGIRKGASIPDGYGVANLIPPSEKPDAVCLKLQLSN